MINKQTALAAMALAMLADSKGAMIMPVAGTPLAELVNLTNITVNSNTAYTENTLSLAAAVRS